MVSSAIPKGRMHADGPQGWAIVQPRTRMPRRAFSRPAPRSLFLRQNGSLKHPYLLQEPSNEHPIKRVPSRDRSLLIRKAEASFFRKARNTDFKQFLKEVALQWLRRENMFEYIGLHFTGFERMEERNYVGCFSEVDILAFTADGAIYSFSQPALDGTRGLACSYIDQITGRKTLYYSSRCLLRSGAHYNKPMEVLLFQGSLLLVAQESSNARRGFRINFHRDGDLSTYPVRELATRDGDVFEDGPSAADLRRVTQFWDRQVAQFRRT